MAKTGDTFTITLKQPHLQWGNYRHTSSRGLVYGEGYIPIPSKAAHRIGILNSNGTNGTDVLGQNIFNCKSTDGNYNGIIKAQGSQKNGNKYAKQFSGNNDLKAIGNWYYTIGANIGDKIKVTWTTPTDITIEKL